MENTVTENVDQSAKAQKAALMMKSNNKLDHFPPASWSCYTEEGSEAAGKSNLTMTKNAEAIDSYISEPGDMGSRKLGTKAFKHARVYSMASRWLCTWKRRFP